MAFTYDVSTPGGMVRFLLNDVDEPTAVFTDAEIAAVLVLEGDSIKLAAAQIIDTNATNEALASKVIKDHQLTTDGAKLADAMRKHAASLRAQVADELEDSEDGFFFGVVDFGGDCDHPERTQYPY